MRNYIKCTAAIISTLLLLISCQNPAGTDSTDNTARNTEAQKKEYTVTFDKNCPSMNGSVWYSCSDYAPDSIKKNDGEYVTLPAFSGKLTKYIGSDEESVYSFDKWNSAADGTGISYTAGASYQVTGNITLYAIYSESAKENESEGSNSNKDLDFSITTTYSMKVGESIGLPDDIGNYSVYYEIQSGSDVVELGSGSLKAIGPGSAIVNAVDWDNSSRSWSCSITVTVEGFTGSALDYKLIGHWVDENSYLVFKTDNTGSLKVYKNSSVLQESTFEWASFENSYGKFFTLSNCSASYLEGKQYTITSISATTLSLHGYLAFGAAQDTTWSKQ